MPVTPEIRAKNRYRNRGTVFDASDMQFVTEFFWCRFHGNEYKSSATAVNEANSW